MLKMDKVRAVLAQKIKKEKLRLKTYGTKADTFSLANAVTPNVMAMMTISRYDEVFALLTYIEDSFPNPKPSVRKILKYLREREHGLVVGQTASKNWADQLEQARPWRMTLPVEVPLPDNSKFTKAEKQVKRFSSNGQKQKGKNKSVHRSTK